MFQYESVGATPASKRKVHRVRTFVALAVIAATAFAGSPANAQESEEAAQTCVEQTIDAHLLRPSNSQSAVFPIDIPAGTVSIPRATSRDFYPARETITQTSERWELQFLDAAGNVIATSAPTGDVPDLSADASWEGALGEVTLPANAVGIRANHRPDLPDDGTPSSVWASGVTVCWPDQVAAPVCDSDADGNTVTPNDDGSCPAPDCGTNTGGGIIAPDANGDCPTPDCGSDADGNTTPPNPDGTCPTPDCGTNPDGSVIEPADDGSCAAPSPTTPGDGEPGGPAPTTPGPDCGSDADGTAVTPNEDGTCPSPADPETSCTDAVGNPVTPNADGSCPNTPVEGNPPPPEGPITDCGNDADGNPVSPNADGSCPTTPAGGTPPPPKPPAGTLPVTGVQSTLLLGTFGLFTLAAGWALVLRPRNPLVIGKG